MRRRLSCDGRLFQVVFLVSFLFEWGILGMCDRPQTQMSREPLEGPQPPSDENTTSSIQTVDFLAEQLEK